MIGKIIRNATLIGIACCVLVVLACTAQQTPAPATRAPEVKATVVQAAWEQDWQKTLAAAKKEESLMIYTAAAGELRQVTDKSFKDLYGLTIEWVPLKAAEVGPKIFQERRAGLYIPDIVIGAVSRQITELKPAGALDPIKPLLVLPEVLDKKLWFGGDIPWVDNEKMYTINSILSPEWKIAVNTTMVKPGEIKSYNDLLDPRWKGKIILIDPVLNGRPTAIFNTLMGADYLRKLAGQLPAITGDQRLGVEWLAQGKYPIMIVSRMDEISQFRNAGASVAMVKPVEGTTLAGGQITASMMNRPAHPNAAKVFVNWYMSKEANIVFSRFLNLQSGRFDVPTDHLSADEMRDPSVKYLIAESEDFQLKQAEGLNLVKEIFGPLMK